MDFAEQVKQLSRDDRYILQPSLDRLRQDWKAAIDVKKAPIVKPL